MLLCVGGPRIKSLTLTSSLASLASGDRILRRYRSYRGLSLRKYSTFCLQPQTSKCQSCGYEIFVLAIASGGGIRMGEEGKKVCQSLEGE